MAAATPSMTNSLLILEIYQQLISKRKTVIHIDIDPAEIGKILHAQTGKRFENKCCKMLVKRSPAKGYKILIIEDLRTNKP